jgi:hypothetical protein
VATSSFASSGGNSYRAPCPLEMTLKSPGANAGVVGALAAAGELSGRTQCNWDTPALASEVLFPCTALMEQPGRERHCWFRDHEEYGAANGR